MSVAQKIIWMLLLKTAPQDLPYSVGLLVRVIVLYLLTGMMVVSDLIEPQLALGRMLLSITIILFFNYVLLSMLNLRARYMQTVSALVGTGIVFNLLAWPVLSYSGEEPASGALAVLISLLVLALISWEILVTAHIFRHTLNTKMTQAILLSMALFFFILTISQLAFLGSAS